MRPLGLFPASVSLRQRLSGRVGSCASQFVAVCLYWTSGWFSMDYVTTFVVSVLLLACDFWVIKNISGRLLVGLRWGTQMKEDGSTEWYFHTHPVSGNRALPKLAVVEPLLRREPRHFGVPRFRPARARGASPRPAPTSPRPSCHIPRTAPRRSAPATRTPSTAACSGSPSSPRPSSG